MSCVHWRLNASSLEHVQQNKPELNDYVGKAEIVIRPRKNHLNLFGQLH